MRVKTYLKISQPIERCLFINVSDISLKLFRGTKLRKSFKVVRYNSEKNTKSIKEYVSRLNIKIIVIETSNLNHLPEDLTNNIIEARLDGIKVYEAHEFYELINMRVPLVKYDSNEYLADDVFSLGKSTSYFFIKRAIDLLISICLLPIAIPLILIGGVLILLTSPGKIFFVQKRIGKNSTPFSIFKLRTMKTVHNGGFTQHNDNRVLPIGKFLRITKIDELPQLLNILKGDMSLIGPRPERPEFVDISNKENAYFDLRHLITPGVTGWAQVNLPRATPDDNLKKLEYDLYYIKNCSLVLDCKIILKTIKVILTMNSN